MKLKICINKIQLVVLITLCASLLTVLVFAQAPTFSHTWQEVEGTIPPGFCILTQEDSTCRNGLILNNQLSQKMVRISESGDLLREGISYKDSYSLTFGFYRSETSEDHAALRNVWIDDKEAGNSHGEETTFNLDNWPPYRTVMACCRPEE